METMVKNGVSIVLVVLIFHFVGCSNLSKHSSSQQKIIAPKLLKKTTFKPIDLSPVEKAYNQKDYQAARLALKNVIKENPNSYNLNLLRWCSRLLVMKYPDSLEAYYYSGWVYFADDRPNTIWDAKKFIFSPLRSALLIVDRLKVKGEFPENIYYGSIITACFAQYKLRLDKVKKTGQLSDIDKLFFKTLEDIVRKIEVFSISNDNKIDLALILAKTRFDRITDDYQYLNTEQSKKDLEKLVLKLTGSENSSNSDNNHLPKNAKIFRDLDKAYARIKIALYRIIWIELAPPIITACSNYPDVLFLGAESLFEIGKHDNNKIKIVQAIELLQRSQKLKPTAKTMKLLNLCKKQL